MKEFESVTITVPPHYHVAARELRKVIKVLQDAFVNRPVPAGSPYYGIDGALACVNDRIVKAVDQLGGPFDRLGALLAMKTVAESVMSSAVADVEKAIVRLVDSYHGVWRFPFPAGLEQGQILVSAVVEQILRKIMAGLELMIDVVDHPEMVVPRNGSARVDLNINIAPGPEMAELQRWVNSVTVAEQNYVTTSVTRECRSFKWLVAFFLGCWIGRHD